MSDRAPLTSVQRPFGRPITGWRLRVYAIIFEADTRAGRLFDLTLLWLILARVGSGDITPKTDLGRLVASVMMLPGWGTLAVPTGIVSAEFTAQRMRPEPATRTCHACLSGGRAPFASFCRDRGARLPDYQRDAPKDEGVDAAAQPPLDSPPERRPDCPPAAARKPRRQCWRS